MLGEYRSGNSRRPSDSDESAQVDETSFDQRIYYVAGNFNDAGRYTKLKRARAKLDKDARHPRKLSLLYRDRSPSFFGEIVSQLGRLGADQRGKTALAAGDYREAVRSRSGFGATRSTRKSSMILDENQIYRIDHYLGKETVQNMMVFRFGNGIFEPLWNRRYIDHVQITVAETVGVEQRGRSTMQSGALRDMVPNHILQLVSLAAMEPPISFDVRSRCATRRRKCCTPSESARARDGSTWAVRGQYGRDCSTASRCPATARSRRSIRNRHRDFRRDAARDRQLALGGRAVLHSHRQSGWRSASPKSRSSSSARRRCCSARPASSSSSQRCWLCTSSPTKASRSASAPRFPGPR